VWQLKPYEVAKAYVNFKDECPVVPPPSQKAAKAAPSSKAPAAAGSSGAHIVMSFWTWVNSPRTTAQTCAVVPFMVHAPVCVDGMLKR